MSILTKLLRGKKADFMVTLFGLAFAIALVAFYIASTLFGPRYFSGYLGEIQQSILDKSNKAEKDLIYLDQAAKYSAYQSAYELASNGGYVKDSPCGNYGGYPVWNSKENECFPTGETLKGNYEFYFDNILGKYLELLPNTNPEALMNYNYELLDKGSVMEIIAKTDSEFSYSLKVNGKETIAETAVTDPCGLPEMIQIEKPLSCQSSVSCEIQPTMMDQLEEAAKEAEKYGYKIVVTSGYRPYNIQKNWYYNGPPGHPEWAQTSFVSEPSCTSPHITGLAADVSLLTNDGKPIDMGSAPPKDMDNPNRRLLEKIMCKSGFVRYSNEYWHYEYQTSRWEKGTRLGACAVI